VRILLVNDYGHPAGGAETIVIRLRDELRQRGHDVRLLASDAGSNTLSSVADFSCRGTVSSFRTMLQCANPCARFAMARVLREFQPDVVHVNLYLTQLSPLFLPLLKDVPAVYYAMWYRAVCPLGTKLLPDGKGCSEQEGLACLRNGCVPLRDWIPLQWQRMADHRWRRTAFKRIVAISHAVAEKLAAFGGSHFEQIQVVHPGTGEFPCRQVLPPEPLFIFAGRLVPEKGCETLLRAFALALQKIPAARLAIVGDGPAGARLRELAGELGIRKQVDFKGRLSNDETQSLMRQGWAVCVPSLWDEPFGMVAAEAQMNGVPVIASNCGGLPEVAPAESGAWLVPPGCVDSLATALVDAGGNPESVRLRGTAAHAWAKDRFGMARFADRFEEIYLALADNRPNETRRD
jgi:glycosyltransferase involved in cell wall biosynthesis